MLSQPDPDWQGVRGHLNREFVEQSVADVAGHTFFLCGPPPFMEQARKILTEMGVLLEQIRQESFGGPAVAPTSGGAIVEFVRSGKTVTTMPGQTLLQAAMENGVAIPSACRQGQCGTCKTRLIGGQVRMMAEQGLDAESKARGFVLTCVGHAAGDVRLDA